MLSSIIFNAALELIFQRWKAQLNNHGWMLSGPNDERLTNARYADDMLLFAKSLPELEAMLQFLHIELAACGLEMHQSKTKVLTNHNEEDLDFIDVSGLLIEILPYENTHRYLGRLISCSLDRSQFEIQHRLKLAWGKYHQHRQWLTNKHVPIQLRLKLFDAVVSPTATFALSTLPLPSKLLDDLGVC